MSNVRSTNLSIFHSSARCFLAAAIVTAEGDLLSTSRFTGLMCSVAKISGIAMTVLGTYAILVTILAAFSSKNVAEFQTKMNSALPMIQNKYAPLLVYTMGCHYFLQISFNTLDSFEKMVFRVFSVGQAVSAINEYLTLGEFRSQKDWFFRRMHFSQDFRKAY